MNKAWWLVILVTITIVLSNGVIILNQNMETSRAFKTTRKITIINTMTDKIIFELTGNFSIQHKSNGLLKIDENKLGTHYIYLNDWIVYIVEEV